MTLQNFQTEAQTKKIAKLGDEVIESGKIIDYILKVANIFHYGDENIFRLGTLSAIQHAIKDYHRGIYINITGTAGKGKTDVLEILQGLLPDHWVFKTSVSPKALYYAENGQLINNANIIFSDDINFGSEELIETLKKITSKYSVPSKHFTVVDKKPTELTIRSKYSFWFTSVASLPDSQLSSRFINVAINESPERDQKVADLIGKNISSRSATMEKYQNVNVCKYIFTKLCETEYGVLIPYQSIIKFNNASDSRLVASFYSILVAVTFSNHFNRDIREDSVISQVEDFYETIRIFTPLYKTHKSKLSGPELKILKIIEDAKEPITQPEIQHIAKKSASTISKNLTNILEQVINLSVEQKQFGNKHYFLTSTPEVDMNDFMPEGTLADIYLDIDKYDEATTNFWRNRE